ncbi:MAG: helix-turn-helix domain-containing protein [archaeon]
MRTPCELIVKFYLPAVRSQVAKELDKKGLTQSEIAKVLGVTQAAVSKYLSGKLDPTSSAISRLPEIKSTAKEIADGIYSKKLNTHTALAKLCRTCRKLKGAHHFCPFHSDLQPGFDQDCAICSHKS